MSVTAHLPVRIRIDPALAGAEIESAMRAAMSAAVGQGLRTFENEILEERGGYARPAFATPAFTWSGRPVAADWRQGLENACSQEILALIRPIHERIEERLRKAPRVVPPDPAERINALRLDGLSYLIPSYQGDTPSPDVALYFESYETARESTPAGHHADWWEWDGSNVANLHQAAWNVLAEKYGGSGSFPQRAGLMFWNRATGNFFVLLLRNIVARAIGDNTFNFTANFLDSMEVDDVATTINVTDRALGEGSAGLRPFGEFTIERLATPSGAAEFERVILAWQFRTNGLSADPVAGEPEDVTSKRIFIQSLARDSAARMGDQVRAFYVLRGGGQNIGMPYARVVDVDASVPIIPIAAWQPGELPVETEEGEGTASRLRIGEGEGAGGSGSGGGEGAGGSGAGERAPGEQGGLAGEATAFHYPRSYGGTTIELDLGPFMGEPSFEELGELGARMRRLMERIAFRLDMPEGKYCGSFLIAAAQVIAAHASGIADYGEYSPQATRVVTDGTGNLGYMEMQPEITPAVQLMRYLGGTCPTISELTELMASLYQLPNVRNLITGVRHGHAIGWLLDFYKEHTPAMRGAVAWVYQRTCQLMMLQLLRASHGEINNRLDNFEEYFARASVLITRLLSGEAELLRMREMLQTVEAFTSPTAMLGSAVDTWRDARHTLTTSLSDQALNAASVTSPGRLLDSHGTLERHEGRWKVRDANGRLWTMDELERDIAMRHQTVQSIDPLIQQFADIPATVSAFQDSPILARAYLHNLLTEMKSNNEDMDERTRSDNMYAFRSGAITESLPNRTVPGTSIAMRGIHLLAHEAIGESFRGNHWYADGLDFAFNAELGRRALREFFETAGTLVFSVICPPVGIAMGIGTAVVHYHEASVREDLFGSLIDPDIIITRAEVEFEMFMAQFELALSIIPDAGAIIRGGSRVGRAALNRGVRGALSSIRRQLMVSVAQQVRRGLVRAFVETILIDRLMRELLPVILGPVLEEVHREISILSGEAVAPRDPAAVAAAGDAPSGMSPEEAELVRRLEEYLQGSPSDDLPPASEAP